MTGISKCGHIWKLNDRKEKMAAFQNHIERNIELNEDSQCWKWIGTICPRLKWGIFNCRGTRIRAQTAAYEIHCGSLVYGAHVLTSCDERSCCNPDHLFIGSYSDYRVQYMKRTTDNKSWSLDASGITEVKQMLSNGKDSAYIALALNIPVGVVNRIQIRGRQNTTKENDGS